MASLQSLVKPGVSTRNDFPVKKSKMALLIIDIQSELTEVNPTSEEYKHRNGFPRMIENTKRLLEAVRENRRNRVTTGSEVIFTYLEALTDDCRDVSLDYKLSGKLSNLPCPSNPAKFLPGISPIAGEDICLPKSSCSVFQSTKLEYILRNLQIEQLVICGQLTDQCVESAVRDAADLGFFVTVVDDACAANSADCHEKGMHGMRGFSRRLSTDQLLQEICDDSEPELDTRQPVPYNANHLITTTTPSKQQRSTEVLKQQVDKGIQRALIRSLRGAGVKFIRFAIVDAYNTIRCKQVPLHHISCPITHPVSIAEVCFAGLPSHQDVPIAPNLSAKNVLTLQPDFASLRTLPYSSKTAMVMCTAHNQLTKELSPLCTRGLLKSVLHEARVSLGIEFCVGAEIEFMLYKELNNGAFDPVDLSTFANSTILNDQEDFISSVYDQLQEQDIPVELIHAESAPGQLEVVLSYTDDVLQLADNVLFAQETIRNVAKQHNMKALFLPKTSMSTAGNGLHLHFSFKEVGSSQNAFSDPGKESGISRKGESFIEGLLEHLPSLLSFSLPTVNSHRRVGVGCWTGSSVEWSTEDKEVPIRVCLDLHTAEATNVEFKLSDATANIYLELAMILSAGIDGMKNAKRLRPIANADAAAPLPQSLQESLDCLKHDEVLLSVLGPELRIAYIAVRESEAQNEKTLEEEIKTALAKA